MTNPRLIDVNCITAIHCRHLPDECAQEALYPANIWTMQIGTQGKNSINIVNGLICGNIDTADIRAGWAAQSLSSSRQEVYLGEALDIGGTKAGLLQLL